ncbi:MAG: GntR family transcriptional regulator [Acidobacteriaceae bacterium]|nr:GntR family transcriptional regulator [Acidobacteriaceae bacterium]
MLKVRARKNSAIASGNGTRGEEAYQKIRTGILKGDFAPTSPLSEYQLAAQFKLSRTPVREALTRLEHEGMVRTVAGRGAFVAELTPHDIMEIYQVREQLESYAARIAAEHMDAAGVQKLKDIIEQMHECAAAGYSKETFETDISLHKTIVRATQNQRMFAILATLDDQMHRIRSMWPRTRHWLDRTLAEHDLIVKCIRKHDADGAEKAMCNHLRLSCERAVSFLLPMRRD